MFSDKVEDLSVIGVVVTDGSPTGEGIVPSSPPDEPPLKGILGSPTLSSSGPQDRFVRFWQLIGVQFLVEKIHSGSPSHLNLYGPCKRVCHAWARSGRPDIKTYRLQEKLEAGLAGFEPATHGPGNRCKCSGVLNDTNSALP
jgi:hypothetical protein